MLRHDEASAQYVLDPLLMSRPGEREFQAPVRSGGERLNRGGALKPEADAGGGRPRTQIGRGEAKLLTSERKIVNGAFDHRAGTTNRERPAESKGSGQTTRGRQAAGRGCVWRRWAGAAKVSEAVG